MAPDQVGLGGPLRLDHLVDEIAHVAGQDHVLEPELGDRDAEIARAGRHEVADLGVDPVAPRQDLVECARRRRLAQRELHEPVQRHRQVGRVGGRLFGIDDAPEGGHRQAHADAVLRQNLLRGDFERLRALVEGHDLDLAVGPPEGVPAGRETLDESAVDKQQRGLVRADLDVADELGELHRGEVSQPRAQLRRNPQMRPHVDALDLDLRADGPEGAGFEGLQSDARRAVERDEGDLAVAGLHDLEQLGRKVGPRLRDRACLVVGELGAQHGEGLDRQLAQRVEHAMPAHAVGADNHAVAPHQRDFAFLHGEGKHEGNTGHRLTPFCDAARRE